MTKQNRANSEFYLLNGKDIPVRLRIVVKKRIQAHFRYADQADPSSRPRDCIRKVIEELDYDNREANDREELWYRGDQEFPWKLSGHYRDSDLRC